MTRRPKEDGAQPGFDARLARLEQIVAALEQGGLELEPAIEHYKEGVGLLEGCRELLAGYRRQVEELSAETGLESGTESGGGIEPYDGDPDVAREG